MTWSSDLLLTFGCYVLVALTAWEAGRGWLRDRDRYRADILWVVGLLVLILLAGRRAAALAGAHGVLGSVFTLLVLLQPYFLLRLVGRFRAVHPALLWMTAAIAICGAAVAGFPAAPPGGWTVIVAAYFAAVLTYGAWAFGDESRRAGGVTGARLALAAVGTWLHVAIACVLGAEAIFPGARHAGPGLRQLLGVGLFACYYAGLVAPRQLRAIWARRELYHHLVRTASRPPEERLQEAPEDLVRAVGRGVASAARAVLLFDDDDPGVLVARAVSLPAWAELRVRPSGGLIGRCLARGTPVVGSAADYEPEVASLARRAGMSAWAVPIVSGNRRWGVTLVVQRHGSLFPDDDLEYTSVVSGQAAATLEHGRLLAVERSHLVRVAETRLRDREVRFSQILQSVRDYAVLVLDAGGAVIEWKAGAESLFGYAAATIEGHPAATLFAGAHEDFETLLGAARSAGHADADGRCRRQDGSEFAASTTIRTLGDDAGFVVVVRDETERRALNERLQQAQKMEAIGQLAGGVAHDFNNLLTALLGHTNAIATHARYDPSLDADLAEVKRIVDRAAALTRRLLAFSRREVVQPRLVNLPDVVADLVPMLRRMLDNSIELGFISNAAAGWIMADPVQIEQIILNLAVNARDAMAGGGRLDIRTDVVTCVDETQVGDARLPAGQYVTLVATDTGVGIAPDVRARMFEPFFTTKEAGRGTGLGLSTVYGIVKQINGAIGVVSEPGRGATFEILVPAAAAPAITARAATAAAEAFDRIGAETILVVEDNDAIRGLLGSWLRARGYAVLLAADAAEAVSRLGDREIDLVLADVMLPGDSGPELVQSLRRTQPALKALYISGYAHAAIASEGRLPPHTHFLAKPFLHHELVGFVRRILDDTKAVH